MPAAVLQLYQGRTSTGSSWPSPFPPHPHPTPCLCTRANLADLVCPQFHGFGQLVLQCQSRVDSSHLPQTNYHIKKEPLLHLPYGVGKAVPIGRVRVHTEQTDTTELAGFAANGRGTDGVVGHVRTSSEPSSCIPSSITMGACSECSYHRRVALRKCLARRHRFGRRTDTRCRNGGEITRSSSPLRTCTCPRR